MQRVEQRCGSVVGDRSRHRPRGFLPIVGAPEDREILHRIMVRMRTSTVPGALCRNGIDKRTQIGGTGVFV